MNPEASPASIPVSDGSESARIAGLCGARLTMTPGPAWTCSKATGHEGVHYADSESGGSAWCNVDV